MLRFDVMSSGVILSRESFRATLIELEKGEWKPLALSWERLACDLSGIHFDQMKRRFRILQDTDVRGRIRVRRRPDYEGEVFFSGGDLYFCVNPPTDPADRLNRIRQEFVSELWGLDLYNPGQRSMIERASEITLLVGIVTSSGDVTARLKTFSDDFESAASRIATVQPSDVSTNNFPESPEFSWALARRKENRLKSLRDRLESDGASPGFSLPEMSHDDIAGSEALANDAARNLLREIGQATFIRESEMFSRRGRKEDEARKSMEKLKDAGLVATERILQCRLTSAPILRLKNDSQDELAGLGDSVCPSCGRLASAEILGEAYSLSSLGQHLSRGNHWMTVWVTRRLEELGVARDAVLWNLTESGEEVDMLIDHLDKLWIVELKDREFGPGDTHQFNYRRVRYRANVALVVTADKVSKEAQRIFTEISRQSRITSEDSALPSYIEGLEGIETKLEQIFGEAARDRAMRRLEIVSMIVGFDVSQLLSQD